MLSFGITLLTPTNMRRLQRPGLRVVQQLEARSLSAALRVGTGAEERLAACLLGAGRVGWRAGWEGGVAGPGGWGIGPGGVGHRAGRGLGRARWGAGGQYVHIARKSVCMAE